MEKPSKKVHFMGIGGSGASSIALLAHHANWQVTGCDLAKTTPYLDKVKAAGIKTYTTHSPNHLDQNTLLAVSPAIFFQNKTHPEVEKAKKLNRLLTWQAFLGQHLHQNKTVICVAGTHGKSTTAALTGLLLEYAQLDPSVFVGATIKSWQTNYRRGQSNLFIAESDEFFDNFLNYTPDIIILNNIEFDHPDYFTSKKQLFQSFVKHLKSLKGQKTLIFNQNSPGIKKLFSLLKPQFLQKLNLIGYSIKPKPLIKTKNSLSAAITKTTPSKTTFLVKNQAFNLNHALTLSLPGSYNVENALGVIALAKLLNISTQTIINYLPLYPGLGRRLELLGTTPQGIHLYDDYAHHPTAVKETLKALHQKHPQPKIICVVEPHGFSRTKALLKDYRHAFENAHQVIIAPIFKSRDTQDFGISSQDIVKTAHHPNIKSLASHSAIIRQLKKTLKPNNLIIVMGAGQSYYLARDILKSLTQP